jgi:hypothetical protein
MKKTKPNLFFLVNMEPFRALVAYNLPKNQSTRAFVKFFL